MKVFYSFVLFCITCLCSCQQNMSNKNNNNTDSAATMKLATDANSITSAIDSTHNANNSLDWSGTYKGKIPIDNHGGVIPLEIMLHPNGTYMLSIINESPSLTGNMNEVKLEGKFIWKDGSTIELDTKSAPSKYRVEENKLIELDRSGKKMTGTDADKYILTKQ